MLKKKSSVCQNVERDSPTAQFVTSRNLQPQDLGGVIFGCSDDTFAECHERQLFGLPRAHFSYVQNIKEGLPLFLFNYYDRRLHGIYEAASNGMLCPESNAWSCNGKEKTCYPAQVAMRLKLQCFPLAESQFRNAILTNYYQRLPGVPGKMRCFHFELDHAQTHALMNMFTPVPSTYNFLTPSIAAPVHEHVDFYGQTSVSASQQPRPAITHRCKDAQEVKSTILDGPSNLPGKFPAEVNQLSSGHSNPPVQSLDFKSCTEAKMMKTGCTAVNKSSPSPPAITQQFQGTETQLKRAVYGTPNNNNGNGALEATDPAGHAQSHCAESMSIQPLTVSSSQECMRDENSVGKGKKQKRKTGTLAIQGCSNAPTAVNKSSSSPPVITQQFQGTETQLKQAVYGTTNNNNANGALEATDPAGHPQSHCAESTSIQSLTVSSSQECMRGESSLKKGSKRKRKTATLAIQGCPNAPTAVNKSSPSPPAITQQFQETETQQMRAVYETPNNNNGNGALEANGPAGHPQSHCAESTSIQPLTISSSQECVRGESSLKKGSKRKRKRKTAILAIQGCPNAPTAVNKSSPSPPAITQQFQETKTQLTRAMYETPNNNNGNRALRAIDPTGYPQFHCAESKSIQPFTISSSQECVRGESSLREGRNWKRNTATLAFQSFPNGRDEKHNKYPTELQSADYTSWYVKDRLIGKITCMICGEEGHYTCDCPMKDQENKVMCTLCNKVGHCYLWCCRQYVSDTRACRRCGEKGHYTNKDLSHYDEMDTNMYVMCSSCDESHPVGRCPMGKVTCFLCEGKGHVPAHCQFSPMLTMTQYYRESFQAILQQALTKKSKRAVKPAKLSSKLELHDDSHECHFKRNDKMVHTVSSFIHCEQGDCEKNRGECKKPPGEMLCDVKCHDEGHCSSSCPKNATPGQCHGEGHNAKCCPKSKKKRKKEQQKQNDDKKLLNGGTSSNQVDCEKNRGDYKKPPGELLCDVKCQNDDKKLLNGGTSSDQGDCEKNRGDCEKPPGGLLCDVKCHDEEHYSSSCPKNTTPGQCHGEGHNAKSSTESKKKRKKEQQKQNDDKKLLNGGTSSNQGDCEKNRDDYKKPPGELLCDVKCQNDDKKLLNGGTSSDQGDCEKNRGDCEKPPGGLLCDVKCHDEEHYSSSCPKNTTPGQCHGEGHNAKSSTKSKKKRKKEQQKQNDDKKLLNGGTSSNQGDCEKNRGDYKKPPGELLCDVKCQNDDKKLLNGGTSSDQGDCEKNRGDCEKPPGGLLCDVKCHDEEHYSSSCPKNTTPGQCHGEGHNAKSSTESKKKRKKEQQKQNDDKKLLNGGTSSNQGDCEKNRGDYKKPPGELPCDVKCQNDDKKLLNSGTSSDQGDCEKNRGDCEKPPGGLLCDVKCHDEEHYSSSYPKNTTPGQYHGEGHKAKSSTESKKKRKKEQQKQNDDKKLLNGGTSSD